MSYQFLLGDGHLGREAAEIARKHDAELINHNDPQCSCGRGCQPYECKRSGRHWFETQNLGEPFNSHTAAAVESDLRAAGILK
jgi:hypothetical protein